MWIKDLLNFVLDNSLSLSLLANGLLVVLFLTGSFVHVHIDSKGVEIQPLDHSVQAQVDSLFPNGETRPEAVDLLFKKLKALKPEKDLLADQLRNLSQSDDPPFNPPHYPHLKKVTVNQ